MDRRRQRQLIFLLTVLPALVFVVAAVIYIFGQVQRVSQHLDVLIVEELRRQTRRDVRVGGYEASPLGVAVIKDLEISNGPTFRSGTLLRADKLVVNYKFWDLVHGKVAPIQSIESVRLVKPDILIDRYRTGKLNIQDFFMKRPGPKRPPFVGVIYFKDGTFTFRDWQARVPGRKPVILKTVGFDGAFDASAAPYYVYNLAGLGVKGGKFGRVALSGSIDNKNGVLAVDVKATDAVADFWMSYFTTPGVVRVLGGKADVSLSATRKTTNGKRRWNYVGSANLRGGRARVIGFTKPAEGLTGRIGIVDQRIDLRLKGNMVGSPFTLAGTIVGFARPGINLRISSQNVDFARVYSAVQVPESLQQVKVAGRGPLALKIIGRSDALAYVVQTTVPFASAQGYQARNIVVRATYSGSTLQVESARAEALGGRIVLGGTIRVLADGTKLALSGTAAGVKLGLIKQVRQAGISGAASGNLELSGTSAAPQLVAAVKVPVGYFNNIALQDAIGSVVVTNSGVVVQDLTAVAAGGSLELAGSVLGNRLDFRAVAVGVDLGRALSPLGLKNVAGVGNFEGTITGPVSNPMVVGNVELYDGRFRDFTFDYARGAIVASRDAVSFKDAVIRMIPAEVTLAGRITKLGTRTPVFDLDVGVVDAPAERLLRELKVTADVTGTVSGRLTVRGGGRNLQATGSVTLTDGSVSGYPISSAHAGVSYSGGVLQLENLTAASGDSSFTASGRIDRQGTLDVTFAARNISLSELSRQTGPYVKLTGSADVQGKVSGNRDNLSAKASVVALKPIINTVAFDSFTADLVYSPGGITASDIALSGPQGKLSIARAAYDSESELLRVEGGNIDAFSYPAVYTLLSESPYAKTDEGEGFRAFLVRMRRPDSGTLSGSFSASGPVDDLQASVKLSGQKIDIAELGNVNVELDAGVEDGTFTVSNLHLTTSDGTGGTEADEKALVVTAHGSVEPDGLLQNVVIQGWNVDIGSLASAFGPSYIKGTATVYAEVTGYAKSPDISFDVTMENPVIYGIPFDSLATGQITVASDTIDISSIVVSKSVEVTKDGKKTTENHSGRLYGKLPWSWARLTVPADRQIDLHAKLDEQSLKILGVLMASIDSARTDGTFSANIDASGTLSNPTLSGEMNVKNGRVGVVGMENDFTNLQGAVRFLGDTIKVEQFSGQSSGGGQFAIVPGGTIALANVISPVPGQPRSATDLAIKADQLFLSESGMFGYGERVSGRLSTGEGGVSITGAVSHPRIAGSIEFARASVLLGPVGERKAPEPLRGAFNPTFDLTLSLGDDVWFNNQSINALMQGRGTLTGSLSKPVLAANVEIPRGWLRFPTERMRISKGSVNVSWTPYSNGLEAEAPRVYVTLEAEKSVSAMSPLGSRRRYNIILSVEGSLLNLQPEDIQLRSDPVGLSRTQILAVLGHFEDIFGSGEMEFKDQLKNIFALQVSPRVLGPLEAEFIEALGLEDFTIEYGFEQPLAVFLSREVFPNTYVSYWSLITGAPSITGATYTLRMSYRLRDLLDFSYIVDSRRIVTLELGVIRRY